MMKTLGAGALALTMLLMPTPHTPANEVGRARKTHVTHNCTGSKYKPRGILFACADGNFYVKRLRWKSWHTYRAKARGVYHFNDCKPDCAGGTFHKRRGRLLLRRRQWCPEVDRHVFKRARVTYNRPWHGRRKFSFKLFCPF